MTIPGELARVTGLSRSEAGRGNRALVEEGYATMPAPGVYRLSPATGGRLLPANDTQPDPLPEQTE